MSSRAKGTYRVLTRLNDGVLAVTGVTCDGLTVAVKEVTLVRKEDV